MDKNRCIIKINDPTLPNKPPLFTIKLIIDNRKTYQDLKIKISEAIKLDLNKFISKRTSFEKEVREMDKILKEVKILH